MQRLQVAAALGAALIIFASPAALAAQSAQPTPLDPATSAAIAPILAQARAQQIPEEPLITKARQGEVNRVPAERIAVAVKALADRLATVRDALAPEPTVDEIRAAGDAVAAGVPLDVLRELRRAQPTHSLAVPLGVLTGLVSRGVPVDRASVQVIQLLKAGGTTKQFAALDADVRTDIANGIPPDAALDLRMKGILPTLPGGGSAAAVDASTLNGGTNAPRPRRP